MPADPHVGARIRRARKLLRLTQQELADRVGVSRNSVERWESGRAYPQRYDVALEQVLGVSLDGGQQPGLADLGEPRDDWEAATMGDPDLPDDIKRRFITDWRSSRAAAYKSQAEARQERERTAARHRAAG